MIIVRSHFSQRTNETFNNIPWVDVDTQCSLSYLNGHTASPTNFLRKLGTVIGSYLQPCI